MNQEGLYPVCSFKVHFKVEMHRLGTAQTKVAFVAERDLKSG